MAARILATKLHIPAPRPQLVSRHRLIERLNQGLEWPDAGRRLTLVSAPAGFGKTTLLGEWVADCKRNNPNLGFAWLSLDEEDSDPARFITYLVSALQTMAPTVGQGVLGILNAPPSQPLPLESILTTLLNDIDALPLRFSLILDDYHLIDSKPVDHALTFLVDHLPAQMHLVIATREDPQLPLARLRGRDQLIELRAADLRFTPSEAADFLNRTMGLNMSADNLQALEARTEGWIAGLQLAALSMQGHPDATRFIETFTGSHHFVLDYLLEEVLHRQHQPIQDFMLRTSILDRLCGPLCDAVVGTRADLHSASKTIGQETLEYLEHANLFIVPLDDERRWYRYHHLFADLLRQRLQQSLASSSEDVAREMSDLHLRASRWYEDQGQDIEAFHHAVAANDIERAAHLVEGKGMPLQFRGALTPVLHWLASLPKTVLDARPALWVMYASTLSMIGQLDQVEQKLQFAEAALPAGADDANTRNLIGHIAAIRALLAAAHNQPEAIIAQSRRALEFLHPDNLAVRTATIWKLGIAYQLQGDREAASRSFSQAIALCEASGNLIINISSTTFLANVQETQNQLHQAAQTYQRAIQLTGDQLRSMACEAQLGLARICYEWNELDVAQKHWQQSIEQARLMANTERIIPYHVLHARLKLARGDGAGAWKVLAEAEQLVRKHNYASQMPEVAAAQVATLLNQGNVAAADQLAQASGLRLSQARVLLAQHNASAALPLLTEFRQQVEAKGWRDLQLKAMVLQAVALHLHGEHDQALKLLGDVLALTEPEGNIRLYVDEGQPVAELLSLAAARGIQPDNVRRLLAAFGAGESRSHDPALGSPTQSLLESLSPRELEILQLIAQGLSNQEIGERLYLALSTVKGYNRNIFDKLQVKSRTEAVARARDLHLI